MRLSDASVVIRPRSTWEAMDLGILLSQRHRRLLMTSWAIVSLPVDAVADTALTKARLEKEHARLLAYQDRKDLKIEDLMAITTRLSEIEAGVEQANKDAANQRRRIDTQLLTLRFQTPSGQRSRSEIAEAFAGKLTGIDITDDLVQGLAASDVLIDFTRPEGTMAHLRACAAHGVGLGIAQHHYGEQVHRWRKGQYRSHRRQTPETATLFDEPF